MRRRLTAIALLAATAATAQVQTTWFTEPGGVAVARDAADQVFTATWDYNPAGDITVTKRNPAGAVLWQAKVDNTDSTRHEVATWVAADSAGNVFVSGTIRSGYSSPVNANALLMKFGPDGALRWRRVYDSDFDGSSTMRVLVDAQDRAYVAGLGRCPLGMMSTLRQFQADGSPGWTWCDPVGIGQPVQVKRTPDGEFVLAARSIFGSLMGFARIDAQGGTRWTLAGITSPTLGDAAGDAAGNTYVVHAGAGGTGTLLRKFSPTGALLWERSHPMSAFRVEVGADGQPVLAGFPSSGTGGAAFARFSATGDLLWSNPDASGVGLLLHSMLMLDAQGGAYVSGSTLVSMGVAKVLPDGRSAWYAEIPGGTSTAMAMGVQGQVYVSGGLYTARLDQEGVVPPVVDLALTLADAPDPVAVGGTLVYTATVRNLGNAAAPVATYTQALPRTVTLLGASTTQGSCSGTRELACALGTLPAGATATVTVTVRPLKRGTLAGQATVGTTAADAQPANNSASTSTTVRR